MIHQGWIREISAVTVSGFENKLNRDKMITEEKLITDDEKSAYEEDGFHIVQNILSREKAEEYRRIVQHYARTDPYPSSLKYPTPGKYTIGGNQMADPGLASIVEHPTVVSAVEALLGEPAHLTAFVAYLRSPGNKGGGAHCDYKRWRPVGSSMNWLFAIIPLNDFDVSFGPLLVSPGSHKLTKVIDPDARIKDVRGPDWEKLAPFIDPELKAGDLLLMDGRTWHLPPPGDTTEDRCGFFLKYCGVSAPPAAGYFPYNRAAFESLSDVGKRLIPRHFNKPIESSRLLIESESVGAPMYLLVRGSENDPWELPGGDATEEEEGVGWDVGARIGALQEIVKRQFDADIPWMSYIGDIETERDVCRVYGYIDSERRLDEIRESSPRSEWFTSDRLKETLGDSDPICKVVSTWQRTDLLRGKGKSIRQQKIQYD